MLLSSGRAESAVASLEQAVALDPADPEERKLLAGAKAPPKKAKG